MSKVSLLARNCTLFTTTKALDEDAYRASLQRFVEFKVGPFLASGGSGEANSLSWDEVRRVYQIGVEVCRGKVPVYANMLDSLIRRHCERILVLDDGCKFTDVHDFSTAQALMRSLR